MSDSSRIWVTLAAVVVAVFVVLKVVAIVGAV